jgi:hypothetical protein
MDPITLIVAALVAGATTSAQATAGDAVKDAYDGLKALIQRRFRGRPEAEVVLAKHEEKPQVWEAPLKDALTETAADQDEAIVKAAQQLMSLVDPQQAASGKYNVQITGNVQGLAQGDHQQVTMTFGDKPEGN